MSIPVAVAGASREFAQNNAQLPRLLDGLSPSDWLAQPNGHANHIAWIVGHLLWARHALINRVGCEWSCLGLDLFARGTKLDPALSYPTPETLMGLWRDSASALDATLHTLTDEVCDGPAPPGPPSPDGKLAGFVGVLAWHETYHLGQIAYLRSWLGQPGIFG